MLTGNPPVCRRAQRGSSLLEVLVAMLLLSLAVLPLAGLHARALQNTRVAQYRATASLLAMDWSERMRANRTGVEAGGYDFQWSADDPGGAGAAPACAGMAICTPLQIAMQDRAAWASAALAAALPGMRMSSSRQVDQPGVVLLGLGWVQPSVPALSSADETSAGSDACKAQAGSAAGTGGWQCLAMRVSL
jgi:type IV pilus assembly protein PilV